MYTCINTYSVLARVIWPATFARSAGPPGGQNGRTDINIYIREYGSTLYIGIAMVFYCTFGPMQKLKFPFSLPYSTQFQFYQHQSE